MKRLWYTILTDIQLQWRNGFYAVTGVVLFLMILLRTQANGWDLNWLMGIFVLGNLMITSFYFIAGLVLLERDEGSLTAQAVSPLRPWEYLVSKSVSLFVLALMENLVIVCLFAGFNFNWVLMILGTLLGFLIYLCCGLLMITRYHSINGFLLPSVLVIAFLTIPVDAALAKWNHWLLYFHPIQAGLAVLNAAFTPAPTRTLFYGFGFGLVTVFVLGRFALRTVQERLMV